MNSFEKSLSRELEPVFPLTGDALADLARAMQAAASAHRLLESLFQETHLQEADLEAVVSFLDASLKLLDLCNAVSDCVNKLRHERVLALLSSENVPRAREEESVSFDGEVSELAGDVVERVVKGRAPRGGGEVSRAVFALEGVSGIVAGLFLGGGAARCGAAGEGLDCLAGAAEALFRSVLRSRNAAVRSYGSPLWKNYF